MKRMSLIAALACIAFGVPAQAADISEVMVSYNQAMADGTPQEKIVAATNLGKAALENTDREDAGQLAYEAGQALCQYADCEGAAPFAEFAASPGRAIAPLSAEDVELLSAYSAWRSAPDDRKTRKTLDEALKAKADGTVSMLSLTAFNKRYFSDAKDGDWRKAIAAADAAAAHFAPVKQMIGSHWSNAKMFALTSAFKIAPDDQQVLDMAQHQADLSKLSGELSAQPEWLAEHYFQTVAWRNTMMAYFQSVGGDNRLNRRYHKDPGRLNTEVNAILEADNGIASSSASSASSENQTKLPLCAGHMSEVPRLYYSDPEYEGAKYGSVVFRMSLEDGRVSDTTVLAAVPAGIFEDQAAETALQWKWIVEEGVPGETCTTTSNNLIMVFRASLDD
ncbi:energy transducer TonB [Henriciella litoralis]|uniref:hypothetical protein n=1 Tax=Henriciella litoralis TaxID=568102 RepID=UPI00111C0B0C|nr:hypothetical protein [Henriciella litoralis]